MANFLSWLPRAKPSKIAPPRVETDTVVPLRFFDDTAPLRGSIVAWTFRINDVLDPEKLHVAATRLLNLPSWRQLGGRLRLNEKGKLELHIPKEFTAARPALRFSHTLFHVKLDDHSLANRLPKPTTNPSVQAGATEFNDFGARPGAPSTIDDFVYSDEPQLAIHVTSFSDATLVGILFPHTMTDAMGIASLVSAISLVLAGRESDVPALRELTEDVLMDVGTPEDSSANEPYLLADWKFGVFSGIRFGLNYVWDMFWEPKMETHIGFLPAHFMKKLRTAAEADLLRDSQGEKPSFLSDGDILTAWGSLMIMSSAPRPRPAIILNVLNMRGRLNSVFKSDETFIQNLTANANTLLSAKEVEIGSVGSIAAKLRSTLTQQITEPQVRAIVKESRSAYTSTGNPPMFGDPTARLVVVTNWHKAKIFEAVDFSPAVVNEVTPSQKGPVRPGCLAYHHASSLKENMPVRHFFNIIGKDPEGNYWIGGAMLPETWQKIKEAMESE